MGNTIARVDFWKLFAGAAMIVAAVLCYYQFLEEQAFVLRFAVLLLGLAVGGVLVYWSHQGKLLVTFFTNARMEIRKVVWPPRKQAGQMSLLVVAMVIVVALILGLLDWLLSGLVGWFLG